MTDKIKEQKADWKSHDDAQLDSWLAATPAQRLAWLEDALKIAYGSGALPRDKNSDPGP